MLVAVGVAIAWRGDRDMDECERIQAGTSAPASIVTILPGERRGSKGQRYYYFSVRYQFEYQGRTFYGRRFQVDKYETGSRAKRDQVMAALQADPNLQAHFEPGKPESAVLDPRITSDEVLVSLAGVCVAVVGVAVGLAASRSRFYEPDLPIRTQRTATGYVVRSQSTRRTGIAFLGATAAVLTVGLGGLILLSRAAVDAGAVRGLMAAGVLAFVVVAVLGMLITPRGAGDLEVDVGAGVMRIRPSFGRGRGKDIALEDVVEITPVFHSVKGATKPNDRSAQFFPMIAMVSEEGLVRAEALTRFAHRREDACELIEWLREQAALPEAEDLFPKLG